MSRMLPFSLICGVTLMTRPTDTDWGVEVKLLVVPVVVVVESFLIRKYTTLSTTFSIAVWLLRTLIFGLDRTLTLPKFSSRLSVEERPSPGAT